MENYIETRDPYSSTNNQTRRGGDGGGFGFAGGSSQHHVTPSTPPRGNLSMIHRSPDEDDYDYDNSNVNWDQPPQQRHRYQYYNREYSSSTSNNIDDNSSTSFSLGSGGAAGGGREIVGGGSDGGGDQQREQCSPYAIRREETSLGESPYMPSHNIVDENNSSSSLGGGSSSVECQPRIKIRRCMAFSQDSTDGGKQGRRTSVTSPSKTKNDNCTHTPSTTNTKRKLSYKSSNSTALYWDEKLAVGNSASFAPLFQFCSSSSNNTHHHTSTTTSSRSFV